MIARMSKVEIIGPKDLLQEVLSLLSDLGLFQIEPAVVGFIEKGQEEYVRSLALDQQTVVERLSLEDLRNRADELISHLPAVQVRKSYLDPVSIIESIRHLIGRHTEKLKALHERNEALQKEMAELAQYGKFMGSISSLLENTRDAPDLDFIGLSIKQPEMEPQLRDAVSRITDWKFELQTERAEDGGMVGLIVVEKAVSDKVKKALSEERIPELSFPESFSGLSFSEKIAFVRKRISLITFERQKIDNDIALFSHRWLPIYRIVKDWLDERLSLLRATASVFETKMCFFINGWMPSDDVERLKKGLAVQFGKAVALEEKDVLEEDMERVPIVLRNPAYFRPFELFTRILPLPAYTSFDPTPFVGIFFPVFFGMILGDAGYALVLLIFCLIGLKKFHGKPLVRDAAKIFLVSSLYALFFRCHLR